MDGITLITCTGGRPRAFALCEEFVRRQTWPGPIQWLVTDDCTPWTCNKSHAEPWSRLLTVTWLRPTPYWQRGQNTLARNLLAAIPEVRYDKVLFFEDDDHYKPEYVATLAAALDDFAIVGEIHAHYYYLPTRKARVLPNTRHASLCQTGIRSTLLPRLADICRKPSSEFIDVTLWRDAVLSGERNRLVDSALCTGIKGLPGRPGIGVGHRVENSSPHWQLDSDLAILRSWIGDDVALYKEFL